MASSPSPDSGVEVVVLLGTSWATLREHNTRWRAVLQEWARDRRIGRLRVVDYPSISVRNLARHRATVIDSWDARIGAVRCRVPLPTTATPLDHFAWRATGRALRGALGQGGAPIVAIAATPLWAQILRYLGADRTGFDAVDDWRALPSVRRVASHVVAGYRAAARSTSASSVSQNLADVLHADFGLASTAIPNGVDLAAYVGPCATTFADLPTAPFAVYVGSVQERVDISLMQAACAVMPVVVAGPVAPSMRPAVEASGVRALGAIPADHVPDLLRAGAVGLIPHHVNALTNTMDPMKLREYLAAGLPVVTTIAPPADMSTRRVIVARGDNFVEAVRAARGIGPLGEPDPDVRHRTWADVADELFATHVLPATEAQPPD